MSGAPSISGTTKFASPANAGMMNRKIISDAWTEKSPLKVCGSTNCVPGLASSARTSIASRPPSDEEEERRDEVLDADHLVVGVDAEVVAPAGGAVAGVVLGPRRAAADVVEPVVEGADPEQEAERRHREEGDGDDRQAGRERAPSRRARGSRRRSRRRREREQRRHPRGAQPAGREQPAPARRRRRGRVGGVLVVLDRRRHPSAPAVRYCTSASSWSSRQPGVGLRHQILVAGLRGTRSGSTIDSRTNSSSGLPASSAAAAKLVEARPGLSPPARPARTRGSRRSPGSANTAAPAFSPPPAIASSCSRARPRSPRVAITSTCERMSEWPSPQSSVQTIGILPDLRRRDHELRQLARHGVLLLPELRHPEGVEHVDRAQLEHVSRPSGRRSIPVATPFGYSKLPRELLRRDPDAERVGAGAVVLREHDRARDADHDHEHRRDRRPDDLDPRVAVDRRAVGVVVGLGAELPDRVEDHGADDREDGDADRRRRARR